MIGKKIKISEFDLKFGNREREINVFSCFRDRKYNNQYVIYSENYDSNFLYFGNAHIKNNKLIVMDIKQNRENIIKNFIEELKNNKFESFEILTLTEVDSAEIITFNSIEYPSSKLLELDNLTIPKQKIKEEKIASKKNKNGKLLLIIILFVIICGGLFVFFNRQLIFGSEKNYLCEIYSNDKSINASKTEQKKLFFDKKSNLINIATTIIYTFEEEEFYNKFKLEKKEYNYMPYENGAYKYIDEELTLKIFVADTTSEYKLLKEFNEVIKYYEHKKYICKEIEVE